MANPTRSLLNLPPELIYEIADHLAPDAILALKLTHPIFNATLPVDRRIKNSNLSPCARFAIRTYLTCPIPTPTHERCIFCKHIYPLALFSSSSSPACLPLSATNSVQAREVVEIPDRFCAWHVGRLVKTIRTVAGGRNERVTKTREMCMHCGEITGWGTCVCTCDSCGVRTVRTYTRYLDNDRECRRFLFCRKFAGENNDATDDAGRGVLIVRETCWDRDNNQQSILEFPVHYEDEDTLLQPTKPEPPCSHTRSVSMGSIHATVPRIHNICPLMQGMNP